MKRTAKRLIALLTAVLIASCAFALADDHAHYAICRNPGACYVCGVPIQSGASLHLNSDLITWDNGDGTHSSTCTYCSQSWLGQHYVYCSDANTSACTICGAAGSFPVMHHESYVVMTDRGDGTHAEACTHCGKVFATELHWAACDALNPGVCQDCGVPVTKQDLFHGDERAVCIDEQHHAVVCKLCGETLYEERHAAACVEDTEACFACGASGVRVHVAHQLTIVDNGNGTHSGVCALCGAVDYTEPHETVCTESDPSRCTGCGAQYAPTALYHAMTDYTDNGDGTHTRICKHCGPLDIGAHYAWCDENPLACSCCAGAGQMEIRHSYEDGFCLYCNAKDPAASIQNGLNVADGYYYLNGERALHFTGLVDYNGGRFLVTNGRLDVSANGLTLVNGTFFYLAGGQLQVHHGFAEYGGKWFYLNGGELDLSASGLYEYDGATFLIAVGRLVDEYTGLAEVPGGGWYFVDAGRVRTDYTGLYLWNGSWFNIQCGSVVW